MSPPSAGLKGKRVFRAFFVLLSVFLLAAVCVGTVGADEVYAEVYTLEQLNANISLSNGEPNNHYTIVIANDIPVAGEDASDGKSVTAITGNVTLTTTDSANHMIYRTGTNTTNSVGMITVLNGGNLTFRDNSTFVLTLYGNKSHTLVTGDGQPLVYVNGGNFTLDGGNITHNYAYYGGGIFVKNGDFTLCNGNIVHNNALNGGGFYVEADSNFTMNGGIISENTADGGYGGGVYIKDSNFTMTGGHIIHNSATNGDGGGVCAYQNVNIVISNGDISYNYAYRHGGGVHTQKGSFVMTGGTISENTARLNAGGVNIRDLKATVSGGYIGNNQAGDFGGGLQVHNTQLSITGGEISSNSATEGGGLVVWGSADVTMTDGEISSNSATNGGGLAIRQDGGFVTMTGGEISSNSATTGGGLAVYGDSGNSVLTITGGEVSSNFATTGGGLAVSGAASNSVTVSGDASLTGNSAKTGDSISSDGNTVTVSGNAEVSSPSGGTGITVNGGSISISSSKIGETAPIITTVSLPDGEARVSYSQSLLATVSSTINWTSRNLPSCFNLELGGKLTSTSPTVGKHTFTVKATNKLPDGTDGLYSEKTYTINVYEKTTPTSLIEEPTKDIEGNTTITNTTGVMRIDGNTTIIGDSTVDKVTMIVTFNETLTDLDTGDKVRVEGNVTNVLASYKESFVVADDWVKDESFYILNLTLKNVTTQLPTINPAFDEANATLIKERGTYQPLAMISATADDMTKVNGNISENGIEIIFKIPKSNALSKIKAFHIESKDKINDIPSDKVTLDSSSDPTYYIIKVIGSQFSTYAIAKDDTKDPEPPKESSSQGSSVWLTETPTPTPTETATPTPSDAVPTDIPDVKPTESPDSPAPILGIIAGLGVLVALRRK